MARRRTPRDLLGAGQNLAVDRVHRAARWPASRRYWQIKLADFVVVFAETEAGEIVCLRQYRHGLRRESLELVAGRIDGDDAPLATARRELLEESGYVSEHREDLGAFTVSATQGIATAYLFRARQAVKRQEPCSGDHC
jgi:ADP-ribose pyrophosphatase